MELFIVNNNHDNNNDNNSNNNNNNCKAVIEVNHVKTSKYV